MPTDARSAFTEACEPLLEGLHPGPARIDLLPLDLHPFAFERGERRIRCFAQATTPAGIAEVTGSFTGPWNLHDTENSVAAWGGIDRLPPA